MKAAIKSSSRLSTPAASQYNSDNDISSIASDISEDTYLSLDSEEEKEYQQETHSAIPIEALLSAMDQLVESRTKTREDSLDKLVKLFRHNYVLEEIENHQETLYKYLKKCLAKGQSTKEKVLASKVMTLLAITLDPEDEEMFEGIESGMFKVARDSDKPEIQTAYIKTLAMVCFVSGVDKHDLISLSHQFIDLLEDEDTPPTVLTAVLNGLGLLCAGIKMRGKTEEVRRLFIKSVDIHYDLLDYPDSSVRIASGENLAMFYEIITSSKLDLGYRNLSDLIAKMNMLLHDRSRFRSKKERLHQRSAFRRIISTLEHQEAPELKLKFRTRHIVIESWVSIKMLQQFRLALSGGLHIHMEQNELLSDVFGESILVDSLGANSPRVINSDNSAISKARAQEKSLSRENRRRYLEEGAGEDLTADLVSLNI